MAGLSPFSLALALAVSAVVSLLVLWVLGRSWQPATSRDADNGMRSSSFLFHDDTLTSQDTGPATLPGPGWGEIDRWSDLRHWLGNRFGPLPGSLSELENGEIRDLQATMRGDHASLTLSRHDGAERVEVNEPATLPPPGAAFDKVQTVFDHAPCAARMLGGDGKTIWQKAAFADYPDAAAEQLVAAATGASGPTRVHLDAQDRVFEVEHVTAGDIRAVFATDITRVTNAETVRREFIQTLTKIFANLTTGLAVFDRNRQLALFNPALLDLTGLPAPFLSSQPPLMQFFDSLRDNRVLPEPKNYDTWRKQIEDMSSTAAGGLYLEDWHLPNSVTYRVTGRPHPDGAIAFLFEDITDNVSLARHFHSQIALREAVLAASDQAKVVFGPDNIVTLCHLACRKMLGGDPDASFADMTLQDFLSVSRQALPGAFWERVEQAVLDRATLSDSVTAPDGTPVSCQVGHLPGNSSIITLMAKGNVPGPVAKAGR